MRVFGFQNFRSIFFSIFSTTCFCQLHRVSYVCSVLRDGFSCFFSGLSLSQLFFRKKVVLNILKKGGSIANFLNFSSCMKSSGASSMPLVCGALAPLSWHCFNHVRSSRAVFAALSKIQSLFQSGGSYEQMVVSFEPSKLAIHCESLSSTHPQLRAESEVARRAITSVYKTSLLENKLSIRMLVQRSP